MKVLFIGGTGTFSNACTRQCLNEGIDLWLVLRGTRDDRLCGKEHVIKGDIKKDYKSLKSTLANHTWDCVVDWVVFNEQDVLRDIEFFKDKTKIFIYISSTAAYEKPLPSPYVNELTPIGNKCWDYADNKAKCERLLLKYYEETGFPVTIVRPGAGYAPFTLPSGFAGLGFGIVKRILNNQPILIHGDGTGLWTLTFCEDFARAFMPLIKLDSVIGETFQITSDELMTWLQIHQEIGRALNREVKFEFASSHLINWFDASFGATLLGDRAHSYLFDNSKIKKFVPSFSPRVILRGHQTLNRLL
ncbi:NAD-dependent epimerase/dehydratase family protein [Chloroflexota bacterium]